jgi:hypothetical protein
LAERCTDEGRKNENCLPSYIISPFPLTLLHVFFILFVLYIATLNKKLNVLSKNACILHLASLLCLVFQIKTYFTPRNQSSATYGTGVLCMS